jgi:hypothetical protein
MFLFFVNLQERFGNRKIDKLQLFIYKIKVL